VKRRKYKFSCSEISAGELFFVIEEGQANLGDFNKALKMIETAAWTGADAIEFQLCIAADFYVKGTTGYSIYKKREFDEFQIKELIEYAKEKNIEFIASPLSHNLVEPLTRYGCAGFNINASDLTNVDVIDSVCASKRPFFLSTPLATEDEINWAMKRIEKQHASERVSILYGQHTMASGGAGVSLEHTFLGYISVLAKKYKVPVGFIDHTPLIWGSAVAVAAGADIVTKHLALSRAEHGPDWQVCLEPEEMKKSIEYARQMKESINTKVKKLAPGEGGDRSKMRRSIVAAVKLNCGQIIKRKDILFKRPGTGLSPMKFEEVIGRKIRRDIFPDEQIVQTDLE